MVNKLSTIFLSNIIQKIKRVNFTILFIIFLICGISIACLYSAAAANYHPWAIKQLARFILGFIILCLISFLDIRRIYEYSYFAYISSFILLLGVEITGSIHKGGQRWIDLYVFKLQPSELMKVTLILALCRYFHQKTYKDVGKLKSLVAPLTMTFLPTLLVLRQPDLGTALILIMSAGMVFFISGIRYWKFASVIGTVLISIPILWNLMHEYQRGRVLTFLNPERDSKGAGYHIIQSKIALGSGGIFGKGWMEGTQSQLNFLPEKQTDFIFTLFGEEFGIIGCIVLLTLYGIVISYGYYVASISRNRFGQLVSIGLSGVLFLYVSVNIGMVMDILPVVGVPLPIMSYGGTSSITFFINMGIIFCVKIHNDARFNKNPTNMGA